ncbi:MAG: hypothetical protein GY856_15720, partial [bacterium]|nr:hypothetical protein [bacterium]
MLEPEETGTLREALSVEPLLGFCTRTAGRDPSDAGREIDRWLAAHPDPAEAEEIFRAMLGAGETFDVAAVGRLGEPQRSHRTFQAYWSIENLARWEHRLIGHFRSYDDLYGKIRRLGDGGEIRRGARETLDDFVELTESFAGNWDAGAAHMESL